MLNPARANFLTELFPLSGSGYGRGPGVFDPHPVFAPLDPRCFPTDFPFLDAFQRKDRKVWPPTSSNLHPLVKHHRLLNPPLSESSFLLRDLGSFPPLLGFFFFFFLGLALLGDSLSSPPFSSGLCLAKNRGVGMIWGFLFCTSRTSLPRQVLLQPHPLPGFNF